MGFTTPCFIRKNTPELRKKLEELRYSHGKPKYYTDDDDNKYDLLCVTMEGSFTLSREPCDKEWASFENMEVLIAEPTKSFS